MSELLQKTKIGILWNIFEKFSVQFSSFVINIILARLLTPTDYGTVGLINIFLIFANVFVDSGFSRALIQKQDRTEKDFSTSLCFSFLTGLVIYGVLFFLSPFISDFYKIPELTRLQNYFYLVIIINSLSIVQIARFQIELDFKKIALINFISVIISGIVGILIAYNGGGSFAIVFQNLIRSVVTTALYWILGKWMPHTSFSIDSFKKLFSFGSKLLFSGLLSTTLTNIKNLVIGKVYSAESLGFYTRGQQFPDMTVGTLASVLNTTTFPLLSTLQDNKEEFITVFRKLIKITAMLTFPCMAGLAVLSKNIIIVLLTEKWLPASFFAFCISLEYMFRPLNILNMNLLNAIGRSDLFLKVDLVKIPIIVLVMIITLPISLKVFVITNTSITLVYFIINAYLPGKLYDFGPLKQLLAAWKSIIATIIMSISIIVINNIWTFNETAKLILLILFGIVVYYVSLKILKEEELLSIEKNILRKLKKNKR